MINITSLTCFYVLICGVVGAHRDISVHGSKWEMWFHQIGGGCSFG